MKRFLSVVRTAFLSPIAYLLWLLARRDKKELIRSDVSQWSSWKKCGFGLSGLFYLYAEYPEFRTLYYYRIGIYSYLFSWLIKGQPCLYIRCKNIGAGLLIQHGFSTIIDAEKIGAYCKIFQQVTIGYNGHKRPVIGNNVTIFAGAKVLGGITIGENVIIGANAVVIKDVPCNTVVGGVPARVLKDIEPNYHITD